MDESYLESYQADHTDADTDLYKTAMDSQSHHTCCKWPFWQSYKKRTKSVIYWIQSVTPI